MDKREAYTSKESVMRKEHKSEASVRRGGSAHSKDMSTTWDVSAEGKFIKAGSNKYGDAYDRDVPFWDRLS